MLLEREEPAMMLASALARVRDSGGGEVVIVAGEAGIGKTVLLREFAAGVGASARILWGGCDALRTPRPLGPLFDLAPAAGPALQDALVGGTSREVVFAAALAALRPDGRPTVMIVDDLHWADEATLDLIGFLGRRIDETGALLLLSYRDDQIDPTHGLRTVVGDLAGVIGDRIALHPLTLPSVAALAAPSGLDPAELYRRTGGNPFYVTECLAAGRGVRSWTPGAAVPDAAAPTIPRSVRDAVLARASRLSPPACRTLEACSISPGQIELWLLESMIGTEDLRHVDECVDGGMLTVTGDVLVFRHELGRMAVLDAVGPVRTRDLHRRALAGLLRPPVGVPDSSRVAYHADEAADVDAVMAHAPAAAAIAAAMGAHRAAAAHLAAALRYADRMPPEQRAELYEQRGHECHGIGQVDEAILAYDEAVRCRRELGDDRRTGELLARRAAPLVNAGRQREAIATIIEAIATLEPLGPSPELAYAYASQGTSHMLARELDDAVRWGERAIALAEQLDCRDHLCFALINTGTAQLMSGDDTGLSRIRRGIEIARREGLDAMVGLGLSQLGSGAGEVRRYADATPALVDCIEWERGHQLSKHYATAWLARCELELGRWEASAMLAGSVLDDPRCAGIARFTALTALGRLRARRGDPGVWPLLDEALAIARETDHLQRLWPVAAARAEAAWLGDHLDAEVATLAEIYRRAEDLAYPWAVGELGFWLWRAHALDAPPAGSAPPFALQIAGRSNEAATAWSALGCPYEAAVAMTDAGEFGAAFDVLDRLGAGPMLVRLSQRMKQAGQRPPRRASAATRANPHGLTDREMDVADCLIDALTNAEIGRRLFISAKTVDHHVSRILAKLGASTRREAAATWSAWPHI